MWATIFPVVTLILGSLGTYLTQAGSDRRRNLAAVEASEREAKLAHLARRETFELDNLLKLKDALMRYARAVGRTHIADLMAARESGVYASRLLPEDVNDEEYQAGVGVLALMHLVLDDELRELIEQTYKEMGKPQLLRNATPEQGEAAMSSALALYNKTQRAIGGRIRAIHAENLR